MTRHSLAIPAVYFLLACVLLLPICAQTNPDNPQAQVPPTTGASSPAAKVSDEDMARLYLVRKQFHEAQEIFHRLTIEQPNNPVYWNELGISFHNQAELSPALKCYQRASKIDAKYADPLNNAGTVYYERQKYAKAIRTYKKAIAVRSDYAAFYLNLGYAYFGEKNYTESIAAFRKALQIDPDVFEASRSRTGTVVQDRSITTDRARFYFMLAKSFAESGNVERCVVYLKKARDEGYKDLKSIQTDPSFAKVIKDPTVQEVLEMKTEEPAQPNE